MLWFFSNLRSNTINTLPNAPVVGKPKRSHKHTSVKHRPDFCLQREKDLNSWLNFGDWCVRVHFRSTKPLCYAVRLRWGDDIAYLYPCKAPNQIV
jgi:hypothetical protein